jgi:hypothetical protein
MEPDVQVAMMEGLGVLWMFAKMGLAIFFFGFIVVMVAQGFINLVTPVVGEKNINKASWILLALIALLEVGCARNKKNHSKY